MAVLGVLAILSIVVLSIECIALGLILLPFPRMVWHYIHHYAFLDESETVLKIKRRLRMFLIVSASFALFFCIESIIRMIHWSLHGNWSRWQYLEDARVDFFIAGPTFLVSLVLPRTVYIVLTHLKIQKELREANGIAVQAQPPDLSCEWLYKPRTMKDIKDAISGAQDTVRSSLNVRLPPLDSDGAENGSGPRFRDEIIARQEREIAELRRALAGGAEVAGPSTIGTSRGFTGDVKVQPTT